jgi:hypothetical protein
MRTEAITKSISAAGSRDDQPGRVHIPQADFLLLTSGGGFP